jgi:ribosomal protein S13
MRNWILIGLLCLGHLSVWAQQSDVAQKQKLAKELIEVTGSLDEIKKVGSQMSGVIRQQIVTDLQRRLPQLTNQQVTRISEVMSKVVTDEMNVAMMEMVPAMMQSLEAVYVSKFTLEELTEIHRFHLSPAGRKSQSMVMNELPQLLAPVMTQISSVGQRIAPRMQSAMQQLFDEGILPRPR